MNGSLLRGQVISSNSIGATTDSMDRHTHTAFMTKGILAQFYGDVVTGGAPSA